MNELLVEFEEMLKNHDWYYEYTDDHRIWCAGRDASIAISNMKQKCEDAGLTEEAHELFMKYRPNV